MNIRRKKFFGISVFDAFIIIIMASLVIGIVKFYKREDQWRLIKIQLTDKSQHWLAGTPYWMGENIQIGDLEKGSGGEIIAEVVDIDSFERGDETRDVYLILKVKGFYNFNKDKFIYKNRPIEIGAPIELHLNKVLITGLVINENFNEEEIESEWLKVKFKWMDVFPWQAEMFKPGLQMKTGNREKLIVEVLSVNSRLSEVAIETIYGNIRIAQNPLKRDVVLVFKLLAKKHGSEYFFAGHQKLKVGEPLWIYFPEVDIDKMIPSEFSKLSVMEIQPLMK